MAKFTQTQLDRIKREGDIVAVARDSGLKLTRKSGQFVTRCPWHDDKEPSLFIHPDKRLFNCFGCDAGGDIIQLVMKLRPMLFTDAVDWLLDRFPELREVTNDNATNETTSEASAETKSDGNAESNDCPLNAELPDQMLLHQVLDFYHGKLLENYAAQDYLHSRGIADPEAIRTFKLGWADRDLGRVIPSKQIKAGRELRGRLTDLGIYRRKTGHGHFNGCVVFPVIDRDNNVREIYGRKITRNLRKESPLHLYLDGDCRPFDDRGIWNCRALTVYNEIILCESIIDALSFWCAGYKNVTCIYGVENLSDALLNEFRERRTKRILLAYDRDDSGASAADRHAKRFFEMGIDVFRIEFPKEMDANEYATRFKAAAGDMPAHKSLGLVIRNATWIGGGPESETAPQIETDTPDFLQEARERAEAEAAAKEKSEVKPAATSNGKAATNGAANKAANDGEKNGVSTNGDSSLAAKPAASPVPAENQQPAVDAVVREQEIAFTFGDRAYRVRGMEKNHSYDQLKINILVRRNDAFHVDTFDLYQSRPRASFIKQAAVELSLQETIIKRDLGKVLLKLEQLQDQQIQDTLAPKNKAPVELSEPDESAALQLLKDENLLQRILDDFAACGVVGEENNKLIGYLSAVSRKLNDPLAVLIQSSSAAGKSSLMDAVLSFVPDEDKVIYSAMTGQSLYYMGGGDLKHKILAISEEEGVRQASYALKLLQSEGSLRIASTGKDPGTGRMETQEYTVEGPVMLFLTTTSYEIDEELQNRCLTLSVCEDQKQTRAIHDIQRRRQTLGGLLDDQDRQQIQTLHQNAQRLLRPLLVANNHAEGLKFRSDRTRTRRDHAKYLTLIRTIALLHQHQREIKTVERNGEPVEYIEVVPDDIKKADELATSVMARSYAELPAKTEQLLMAVVEMVHTIAIDRQIAPDEHRFTRKQIHAYLDEHEMGISTTHLKRHLAILEDAEYLIVHSGGGRGRLKTYQLEYSLPESQQVTTTEVHENDKKSISSPQEVLDFFRGDIVGKNGTNHASNGSSP
jgi:DNA primase catalytic core